MSVSYGPAVNIFKMAALKIQRGEDWPLHFFSRAPSVAKFLYKLCGVSYYT